MAVRRWPQGLGEERALLHGQRQPPALCDVHDPLHGHDVADVEAQHAVVFLLSDRVHAGDHLNLARQVAHVEEGRLAVLAARHQATGDLVRELGVLALLQLGRVVGCDHVLDPLAVVP